MRDIAVRLPLIRVVSEWCLAHALNYAVILMEHTTSLHLVNVQRCQNNSGLLSLYLTSALYVWIPTHKYHVSCHIGFVVFSGDLFSTRLEITRKYNSLNSYLESNRTTFTMTNISQHNHTTSEYTAKIW